MSCFFIFILDPTLTTDNVVQVMELVNDWSSLSSGLGPVIISSFQQRRVEISTRKEISSECASYYVHYHPEPSWTHLADRLYFNEEFAAVEKLKTFLPLRGN